MRTKTTKFRKHYLTKRGKRLQNTDFTHSYKIGDSFFSLPVLEVQDLLSQSVEKINGDVSTLEEKLSGLREEMQELKGALYGRFGRSINLEA